DRTARIWDIHNHEPVMLLNVHAPQVTAVAVSPDGTRLFTADSAQDLRVWDFASRNILYGLKAPPREPRCLAVNGDGKKLAVSGDRTIQLVDVGAGKAYAGSGPRPVAKTSIALHSERSRLACNSGGLAPRIWSLAKLPSQKYLASEHPVHALAFSPDGNLLA